MKRSKIRAMSCVMAVALSASSLAGCNTISVPEATTQVAVDPTDTNTNSDQEYTNDKGDSKDDHNDAPMMGDGKSAPDGAGSPEGQGGVPGGPDGSGEGPGGPGMAPGGQSSVSKVSVTEGDWSFDVITTGDGDDATVTSTITYYAGKEDSVVVIPSILGGAPVTEISAQAFGHHSEIMAVYVPDTVTTVSEWAFYDLNTATIISFANPDVSIDDAAFQSSGNAVLYMPKGTSQTSAGGKDVVTDGTELISVTIDNTESAAIAGGTYLNVTSSDKYKISIDDITRLAVSASGDSKDVEIKDSQVTFSGDAYVAEEEKVEINEAFADSVQASDLTKTLWYLSEEDAQELKEKIESDTSYSKLKSVLQFDSGYYINGNKVTLDENVKAYDVKTGDIVDKDSVTDAYPATGSGNYRYMFYEDSDNDGDIDILYYSPYSVNYSYDSTIISSDNENLNGLSARDSLNPIYLSFANGVVEASGEDSSVSEKSLNINTSEDGDSIDASNNQERSLIWANDYADITVDQIDGTSTSTANWAKMSYVTGLSSYNVEIAMEWGMNALLYATNGGSITVGTKDGEKSTFYANGDGANGVIAGGSGTKTGDSDAKSDTANVSVYNASFTLEGWNNHVADVVYGGYAYLEDIDSTTGIKGSYSVGQASALANDFGNGVVDVKNFNTTVYGNRSAGAYVIGGGVITAEDSSFTSKSDSGAVIASGGTYKIKNSILEGVMGIRNRGGINSDSTSTFDGVTVRANKDMSDYVTGDTARQAMEAWEKASGTTELMHYMMSDASMTIGQLCDNYDISDANRKTLLDTLSDIADETYTESTMLRGSVLDNTFYNYSAGGYTGDTDYSDVPYLVVGSAYGGLVSSVMEFESAGENLVFTDSIFENTNSDDYDYLIASEAGSAPVIYFNSSDASGIIWNEGDVSRVVEGMSSTRSSALTVSFEDSDFTGSFADGSNGLWEVSGLSYTDAEGNKSSLNGNYYDASANWGIKASFAGDSVWTVTHDSYLGSLTIKDNASIVAPKGYKLTMTVDGKETEIKAGSYEGEIVISVTKE